MLYEWDEDKRLKNIKKHGLDFMDADLVFESSGKVIVDVTRAVEKEKRYADFAEVKGRLLKLVYTPRGKKIRVISLRVASVSERRSYEKEKNSQVSK